MQRGRRISGKNIPLFALVRRTTPLSERKRNDGPACDVAHAEADVDEAGDANAPAILLLEDSRDGGK